VLRILFTRLRQEEKLLLEAARRLGLDVALEDVKDRVWGGVGADDDVYLCRCIGHGQNLALARHLEGQGRRVVNPASVMELCGDKLATTAALEAASIAQPAYRLALSEEGALAAAEEIGYPAVFKPVTGSWGRLLAKVNDREAAEAVVEHKAHLGAHHQIFYVQEYVEKSGFDVRAFVVGGEPICAIRRESAHWITNTARGGRASNQVVTGELEELLRRVHGAVGGDFLAVDLFGTDSGWLVNEVNDGAEFRNSIAPTGVDIPEAVVRHCAGLGR
jgi:[lysine-biosynthesis-protein LysW]--L-2-aminoadipate ligase